MKLTKFMTFSYTSIPIKSLCFLLYDVLNISDIRLIWPMIIDSHLMHCGFGRC